MQRRLKVNADVSRQPMRLLFVLRFTIPQYIVYVGREGSNETETGSTTERQRETDRHLSFCCSPMR